MENTSNSKVERVIFPPNKPMDRKLSFSTTPKIYDNLLFIDFNSEGNCILGSNNLSGTFWEGTLLYFKDQTSMDKFDYNGHYIYASTSDGKFVNNKLLALAEDTGNINILSIDEDTKIRSINYFKVGDQVCQLGIWENSSKLLSCSGRCIEIWEANSSDRNPLEKYGYCHLDTINTIDTLKKDTNCFISGGRDKTSCIWDLRISVPVSVLYRNEFSSITSVSWNQEDDNYVAIGTAAGDLYLVDKREPEDFISVLSCFQAPIHNMDYKNSRIAVCGETNEILVAECKDYILNAIYKNNQHKSFVRDVKWYDNVLYSCGFGTSLVKHVIPDTAFS